MECKKEITGLVKKLCASCAAITVGVQLINNISRAEREIINFGGGRCGKYMFEFRHLKTKL